MRIWRPLCAVLLTSLSTSVDANEVKLNQDPVNQISCSGMYSRKAWGGSIDPFILISFQKDESSEPTGSGMVGLIVYEFQDKDLLGKLPLEGQPPVSIALAKVEAMLTRRRRHISATTKLSTSSTSVTRLRSMNTSSPIMPPHSLRALSSRKRSTSGIHLPQSIIKSQEQATTV